MRRRMCSSMNHHNATMIASFAAAKDSQSQSVNQPGLICPRVTDERKRREGEINEGGNDRHDGRRSKPQKIPRQSSWLPCGAISSDAPAMRSTVNSSVTAQDRGSVEQLLSMVWLPFVRAGFRASRLPRSAAI